MVGQGQWWVKANSGSRSVDGSRSVVSQGQWLVKVNGGSRSILGQSQICQDKW